MERRNSKDGPPPPPHNPDVFDDEYALDVDEDEFMPSVSDGFRPTGTTDGWQGGRQHHDRQDHDRNDAPRPSLTITKSPDTDLRRVATRNSTAKVPFARDSTSHDGRGADPSSRGVIPSATSTPLQHRESVSSTASFATMAASDGPFGSGPSHPYGMYPQHTMARSSSIATASTQQPRTSQSLQRPAHPYGMYTQNVVEDEPPMPQVQTNIPVGFPGINTGFRRQIGPDGEEQDIIGLDGHTEQLPPYSRYPEEGPTKASMAAEASATPVEPVPNPLATSNDALIDVTPSSPVPPASPVSPLTPAPSVAAVVPARLPQQRPETQSGNAATPRPATTSESASLLTTEDGALEKPDLAGSIRSGKRASWRSKKLWGKVPVTVALLLLVLLLIFAMVLGAILGTFLAKNNKKNGEEKKGNRGPKPNDPEAQNSGHSQSLFDASPIPTPSSLPPLPTGQFVLPLGYAQESSPGCLTQGNQYAAWSCKRGFPPLILTINLSNDANLPSNASLESFPANDGTIQWGLQPPVIKNESMQLVTDLDLKGYGPAWHFSATYDKVVILAPDEFAAGASLRKRQGDKPFRHRFQIQPGDNPWYCTWNGTYIEGYIYAQYNSTAATMTGSPTPNPSDPMAPLQPTDSAAAASSAATSTPVPTQAQRRDDRPPPPPPRLPVYPRLVKIEERRVPGAPQPYCQKMQLLDNGRLTPASGENGGSIVVQLQEQDPDNRNFPPGPPPSRMKIRDLDKRRDPSDACHCQWMSQ